MGKCGLLGEWVGVIRGFVVGGGVDIVVVDGDDG